jgi:hypothetical protein
LNNCDFSSCSAWIFACISFSYFSSSSIFLLI